MVQQQHDHHYGEGISDERYHTLAELGSILERYAPVLKNLMFRKEDGTVWYVYDAELWRRRPHSCEARQFKYHTQNPFGEETGSESGCLLLTCESTDAVDYTDDVVQLVCDVFRRHNAMFTFRKKA